MHLVVSLCLSIGLSVCLSELSSLNCLLTLEVELDFWHGGQGCRSKVKVKSCFDITVMLI